MVKRVIVLLLFLHVGFTAKIMVSLGVDFFQRQNKYSILCFFVH